MPYAQEFALSRNQTFRDAVGGALLAAARAAAAEAAPATPAENPSQAQLRARESWQRKQDWADDVLGATSGRPNIMRWIDVAIPLLIQVPALVFAGQNATDAQLDAAINAILPKLARRGLE